MVKIGRPRKENARVIPFRLKVNNDEMDKITKISERTGMTNPEVIRKSLEVYANDILNDEDMKRGE